LNLAAKAPKGDGVEQPAERAADHYHLRGHAVPVQHDGSPPCPPLQTPSSLVVGPVPACSKASRKALGSLAPDRATVLLMRKYGTPCTPERRACSSAARIAANPSSPLRIASALPRSSPAPATTSSRMVVLLMSRPSTKYARKTASTTASCTPFVSASPISR